MRMGFWLRKMLPICGAFRYHYGPPPPLPLTPHIHDCNVAAVKYNVVAIVVNVVGVTTPAIGSTVVTVAEMLVAYNSVAVDRTAAVIAVVATLVTAVTAAVQTVSIVSECYAVSADTMEPMSNQL